MLGIFKLGPPCLWWLLSSVLMIKVSLFNECYIITFVMYFNISAWPKQVWSVEQSELRTLPTRVFLKGGGGSKFYFWKILKRGWWKWAGVFKGVGAGTYPIQFFQGLSFLHLDDIIFTFRNYFTLCLCKIVLCIWRKIIFYCHHNFM